MKTERRHELQTNELAIRLAEWIEKIKPYSKAILGVLVLIITVSFAVAYVNSRNQEGQAAAWDNYFNAYATSNLEEFKQVAENFPDSGPAMWALQTAGDTELASGAEQLFRNRDGARDSLQNARETYDRIVQSTTDKMLKPRALFGLGQSLEALGEFSEAEKNYQAIIDGAKKGGEFDGSVVAELAQHRLDALQQTSTKDWYQWFAEQKPIQSPLTSPGLFQDLPNLPDQPNLNLPGPGQFLPGTGTTEDGSADSDTGDSETTENGPTLFDPADAISPENSTDEKATTSPLTDGTAEGEVIDADVIEAETPDAVPQEADSTESP